MLCVQPGCIPEAGGAEGCDGVAGTGAVERQLGHHAADDGRQLETLSAEADGLVQALDRLRAVRDWVAVRGHVVYRAVAAHRRGGGEAGDAARRAGP